MPVRASLPILVALCLAAAPALGSESFPGAMKGDLDLGAAPGCKVCHREAAAPVGPADRPFAKSLEARGLVAGDLDALAMALAADRGVDSDGDGAEDLDELSWGGDPNVADLPVGKPPPQVSYGCGAHGESPAPLGALALAAGLVLARRRRARRGR